jgi:hypothetical protein
LSAFSGWQIKAAGSSETLIILHNNNNNNNNNDNEIGVQLDKTHWYEHVPKSVVTNQGGKVTILWNRQVKTDRTIPNNKPDIVIRDNEK